MMECKYGNWFSFLEVVGDTDGFSIFMTSTKLAEQLGVSRQSIYSWIKEDYLTVHKYKGQEGNYSLVEVEDMGELISRVQEYKISRL